MKKPKLSPSMSLTQFENGYWYATELADLAEKIGIGSARKLRKDELEKAITEFLRTGKVKVPTKRSLSKSGVRDVDQGLCLDLLVTHYTSNKQTKDFIVREAEKMVPGLRRKSGARYRLNRWREEQLTNGVRITYRDLVNQYVILNTTTEPFARIPHVRYINFLADFLRHERGSTHQDARRAWCELKKLDVPKDYRSWVRARRQKPLAR